MAGLSDAGSTRSILEPVIDFRVGGATQRAGANFPHFVVARRSKILHIRRSSLLELRKIAAQRRLRES
jgi:hypothetical protein